MYRSASRSSSPRWSSIQDGKPIARHRRSISASLEARLLRRLREVVATLARGKQLLDVAEREPPVLARLLDLVQRVSLLAQARDDPRVGGGRAGPAAAVVGDDALRRPSACSVAADTPAWRAASARLISSGSATAPSY